MLRLLAEGKPKYEVVDSLVTFVPSLMKIYQVVKNLVKLYRHTDTQIFLLFSFICDFFFFFYILSGLFLVSALVHSSTKTKVISTTSKERLTKYK
jgi:hypothetical protein